MSDDASFPRNVEGGLTFQEYLAKYKDARTPLSVVVGARTAGPEKCGGIMCYCPAHGTDGVWYWDVKGNEVTLVSHMDMEEAKAVLGQAIENAKATGSNMARFRLAEDRKPS